MKITAIKDFLIHPFTPQSGWIGGKNWLFVKVETDEGITGWGEAYTQVDRDKNIVQHINDLSRYMVGQAFHAYGVQRLRGQKRGAMDLFCAMIGIEQALWDIVGKRLGTPVYNLLGGPCRGRERVYANGWYGGAHTPEDLAQKAVETAKMGFSALKFDPLPGPWRLFISRQDERVPTSYS